MERSEKIEDDFNKWHELTYNNYEPSHNTR